MPLARRALSSGTADVRVQARAAVVLAHADAKDADSAAVAADARALLLKIKDAPGLEPRLRSLVRATLSR